MRTGILKELSLLNDALSSEYYDYFLNSAFESVPQGRLIQVVNIYQAFCFLTKPKQYNALDILNSDMEFNRHFELLVGFIYREAQVSISTKYVYLWQMRAIFKTIAVDKQFQFYDIKIHREKVSKDAQSCILKLNKLNFNTCKLNYLKGWQVHSKDGKKYELHLDSIYVAYGLEFTQQIHKAIICYAYTQKKTSLQQYIIALVRLFKIMTQVCPNHSEIQNRLSFFHVQSFFQDIMNVAFTLHLAKGNTPQHFFSFWKIIVTAYTQCFIDTGVFDAPSRPFIVPVWKNPQKNSSIFSVGGKATEKEKECWFTDIPLRIKDEETIAIIQTNIDKYLAYLRHICLVKFNEFKEREVRNSVYIQSGNIKPLSATKNVNQYKGFVGDSNLANTVATFYAHGIDANVRRYGGFLGYHGRNNILLKELNLPSTSTLAVLSTLLILEHPQITPSWLAYWELFDRNGKQTGFKKSNNQYVAVSYKERKGAAIAQQDIVLNQFSSSVVKFLIQHTSFAREHLKSNNNPDWRRMLLTSKVTVAHPVNQMHSLDRSPQYLDWLSSPSLFEANFSMEPGEAKKLANLTSLRSVRKHRGLQIYLETRSMTAVSEALGHKQKDLGVLSSYLPEPLMDFFNERWIRQFQNAILLEALKGSPHRLDVVSMTAEDIEEFLANHGLGQLPPNFSYSLHGGVSDIDYKEFAFEEMTFMISTSLLQLLIAIKTIVENNKNEHNFLDIVNNWYQSAVFILHSLSTEQYRTDVELVSMLEKANQNVLDINLVQGALTC